MALQIRNNELVDILSPDFPRRNEPNFAWQNALSMYCLLPGLRGFWPMSAFDSAGYPQDLSGNGNHVDVVASDPAFDLYGLAPFSEYDGNDAFGVTDRADFDITGIETFVTQNLIGITVGCWTRLETLQKSGFICKWDSAGNQRSYALDWWDNNNTFTFHVSDAGTWATQENVESSYAELVDTWYFVVGTWSTAGFEIFVGAANDGALTKDTAATTHASINTGTANLNLGVWNENTDYLDGDLSLCFVCNALLPDYLINALFGHSRWMFRQ